MARHRASTSRSCSRASPTAATTPSRCRRTSSSCTASASRSSTARSTALRQWDFFHCPAGVEHVFVGAGDGPCAVLMIGSRRLDQAHYPVNEVAAQYDASVSERRPTTPPRPTPTGAASRGSRPRTPGRSTAEASAAALAAAGDAAVERDHRAGHVGAGARAQEQRSARRRRRGGRCAAAAPLPSTAARASGSSSMNAIILLWNGPGRDRVDRDALAPPGAWRGGA